MKFILAALVSVCTLTGSHGFVSPATQMKPAFGVASQRQGAQCLYAEKKPFFASVPEEKTESEPDLDSMTVEEEVEMLVQQELATTQKISKLKNKGGVEYAPWMNINADDEEKIRAVMREKAAARRRREEQERQVSGNLYFDSQAQELSGTGLNYKIIDGEVEIEWATKSETDTKGFVVKRRPAKTDDFEVIATYKEWGPLASQGKDGGIYRYLDSTASPGGWVYRVSEVDNNGAESDLCQCLVEIQTEEEQRAAVFAGVGIAVLAIVAFIAGLELDPLQ